MPARSRQNTTGRRCRPTSRLAWSNARRQERGVDGDDRAQAAHGHARGRGDRVLLGDADVEEAVGEALLERQQAGGAGHGGGDGHELGPRSASLMIASVNAAV